MPASERVGNKDIVGAIEGVLKDLIGLDRYQWWFSQDIELRAIDDTLLVLTTNQFRVDRVRRTMLKELKTAAAQVCGKEMTVQVQSRSSLPTASPIEPSNEPHAGDAGIFSEAGLGSVDQPISSFADPRSRPQEQITFQPSLTGLDDQEIEPQGNSRQSGTPSPNLRGGRRAVRVSQRAPQKLLEPQKLVDLPLSANSQKSLPAIAETHGGPVDATVIRSKLAATSLSNFCVGPCNTLAHVAAKMVTDQPGTPSPLFFWGPAGTGKTHLLAAIRNELRGRHRLRRVVMLSAEQFTNDFTGAVRGGGLPSFRNRYRDVDALLIDDVQFVGGKRATLRELLYTVDSLLRGRCQLAFTADRPPLELDGLNEELAGRMAGGMVCPLKPLDQETRLKVLRSLAQVTETVVVGDVLERMAEELVGDGRVLSGAFNHLRTLGAMLGRPATWDELMTSAPDLIAAGRPAVNLGDIQKAVCDMFGLPQGSLSSRGQHRSLSQPRMLAMYLARQYTRAAFSEIGQFFGDRSHSTVIAATKRVESWLSDNKPLRRGPQSLAPRQAIEAIENLLRTG